jgi:flagellar hook-associated protein 1 FlgK
MSLSAVLGNALSGLNASQVGLRTSSNNVANVNTPGYARTSPQMQSRSIGGVGMGVEVAGVKRAADSFLQAASLRAAADLGQADVSAAALDRLQAQFGGLDDPGSLVSRLNTAFGTLNQASVDPSLSVSRISAAADLQSFFDEAERLSLDIKSQRMEADARIGATLTRVNEMLGELLVLNSEVQSLSANGSDTTGASNRMSELLDELSGYIDIRADYQTDGRVVVRTQNGVLLLDNFAMELAYTAAGTGAYETNYGRITATAPGAGSSTEMDGHIQGGELRALLNLRDTELPDIAAELGELVAGAADALNAAHNDASAYPPPNTLTGHNTGLSGFDGLNFTGATTLAVTDATGTLIKRVDIDFDAGTLSVDGGAPSAIGVSVGSLTTALNTALGVDGTANFINGVMTVSADVASNGVAFLQDTANPSDRGGRGFSHFFGLNDLIRAPRPAFFQTGLTGAETHELNAGGFMSFRVQAGDGRTALETTITPAAGGTFNDIITAINDTTTGIGRYATASLDANGQLSFTPVPGFENFSWELTADSTARTGSNISVSQLFGIGLASRAGRAEIMDVDSNIRGDANLLALGKLDLDGASVAGDIVLNIGDNRGAQEMQTLLSQGRLFDAAGTLAGGRSTLNDYAARFVGAVGARAARAESESGSAQSLLTAAQQKRADVEGVNLDEELANMTLYQTSYNASARMLQAAKEMTDTLMNMV